MVISLKRTREEDVVVEGPWKKSKVESGIQELPTDLISHIFSFLTLFGRLGKQGVCKGFKQAVEAYPPTAVWIQGGIDAPISDTILFSLKKFPITSVTINGGNFDCFKPEQARLDPGLTDAGLATLTEFPALTSLTLKGCNKITNAGFSLHVARLKLEHLKVNLGGPSVNKVTDVGFSHIPRISSLKSLTIFSPELRTIFEHFPESHPLQVLEVQNCYLISTFYLPHLKVLKNLTDLNLSGTQVWDENFDAVEGLSQLRSLNLSGTKSLKGKEFIQLAKLLNLEQLLLAYRKEFVPDCFRALQQLPRLRWISLFHSVITDGMVDDLLNFKHLTTLKLDGATITEHNYNRLRDGLPACKLQSWDPTRYNLG